MTRSGSPALTPTAEQFRSFQALFDHFNRSLFGGELAPCLLNFSRKAHCAGFFAPSRWQRSGGQGSAGVHEISINPSTLKTQAPISVCQTLVHEMAHQWQHDHGSPSRRGYHDRQWADKMESIGLIPSSTGKPGGRKVGQRMCDYPEPGGRFELSFKRIEPAMLLPFVSEEPCEQRDPSGPKQKDPSKTKYTCPMCGANVWGKPGLEIACLTCDAAFDEA